VKFAQIMSGKTHWIFESEGKPVFAPNIVLVEITNLEVQPQEGWDYDVETGVFTEPVFKEISPVEPQPTSEEMQSQTLLNTEYLVIMSELTNL